MAKKKKFSKQQIRRIQSNRQRKLQQKDKQFEQQLNDLSLGSAQKGRVISRFGQHADVEDEQGRVLRCDIRRTIDSLVTGDYVVWREKQAQDDIPGVIEAVEERTSILKRPDFYDGLKPVAANIDQVVILSSIAPELSLEIIDRYLIAVENMGSQPVVLINKSDLLSETERLKLDKTLDYYRQIGYQLDWLSVKSETGLQQVETILQDKTSIVVGQSGVGKSSLVQALLPEQEIAVGEIDDIGLGKHTTTVAKLYHLKTGGILIDSPGVREFALWHLEPDQVFDGFIEFSEIAAECKFRDCSHQNDPGCALRAAAEQGKILPSRLEHYHKIVRSNNENKPAYRLDAE
ncbi:small ribosomal subunit biogenesis GTPase RsgA [Gayadomonas joobiniege]|uniref:small ribosomal subunit biogenesis GTPase RsgA n=1 Tax=Gayadomonas joobiniege TaxID=1234606 RepID=UPI00035DC4A6|nr:small ribosomal subunit biogenesis GTPase RsgA [Gayadomonas joobiniege]